jgi:hypothetical protein
MVAEANRQRARRQADYGQRKGTADIITLVQRFHA